MKKETIFENIRSQGGRITPIKNEIIQLLLQKKCLVSQKNILEHLNSVGLSPSRSTIFRELISLSEHNIIFKNTFSNKTYYEIPCQHHHHLICLNCQLIEKIDICNHIKEQEKEISRSNGFNIIKHSLEFYGYCQKCQAQKIWKEYYSLLELSL